MGLTPKKPPRQNGAFSKDEWNSWQSVQNRPARRESMPEPKTKASGKLFLFLFVVAVGAGGFWLGKSRRPAQPVAVNPSSPDAALPNPGAGLAKVNRVVLHPETPTVAQANQNSAPDEINIIGQGTGTSEQPVTVVLDEGQCKKTVWSVPSGARVLLNRTRYLGTTPLRLQGKCELPVTLGFEADEHDTIARDVALEKEDGLGLSVTLPRTKKTARKGTPMAPSAVLEDVQKKLGDYMKLPTEIE